MNHTPERPLNPPEPTIVSEPDFERDPLSLQMIDAKVVTGSFLVDRIQLALNNFNADNADIDVMANLLAEAQKDLIEFQQRINRTSDDIQLFIDDLIKKNELARQAD
jgi:hypothetical protein